MTDPLLTASSRSSIPPFHAMAMNRLAEERTARGLPVYHLEVGQPSTPAPSLVREAAAAAISSQTLGYTNAPGIAPLRQRIAEHYTAWYGVSIDPERILVTAGASGAFTLAFLAAFDPGDRVGVIEPGYPCYRNALMALGCEVVPIPVGPDTRWAPTPEMIASVGPLAGLVIASPSNPTGTALPADVLSALVATCRERGIRLIADEIYHGITFTGPAPSVLQFDTDTLVVNSFSKYFSMTGWRLGWIVAPEDLLGAVERFQQNFFICAPAVSQVAAVAAFDCHEELQGHVREYARKREILLHGLARAGLTETAAADGAFYVYADVSHLGRDSLSLCRQWLDDTGVTATPGIDFDLGRGNDFVRFSYAGSAKAIEAACAEMADWTARHG
jgi:aspartate/methionine/tyrosine aminotransferase